MIKLGTHGVELEAGVNVVNTLASSMSRGKYSMAAAVLLGRMEVDIVMVVTDYENQADTLRNYSFITGAI